MYSNVKISREVRNMVVPVQRETMQQAATVLGTKAEKTPSLLPSNLTSYNEFGQVPATFLMERQSCLSWKKQALLRAVYFLQALLATKSYGFIPTRTVRSTSYGQIIQCRYNSNWLCVSKISPRLPVVLFLSDIDDIWVSVYDDSILPPTDEETRLYAQDFFNELRGTKKAVAVKDLASSYYFESMLFDGGVTRKQLADIVGGKRVMGFEEFFDVCITLNRLQDEYSSSDDYDNDKIAKVNEAREVFDNLRGSRPKLSLTVFKSLYYFDEMIKDGIISKESFSIMSDGKRQLDFETFFRISTELDKLIEEYDSTNVSDKQNVEDEKLGHNTALVDNQIRIIDDTGSKLIFNSAVGDSGEQTGLRTARRDVFTEDELENSRKSDEMESLLRSAVSGVYNMLSNGSTYLSLENIKKWEVVDRLLLEGFIEKDTVDYLASILGLTDDIRLEDFVLYVGLLDEATGMGIMEVPLILSAH